MPSIKIKQILLLIALVFFITPIFSYNLNPKLRLNFDLSSNPFFYENTFSIHGMAFNGSMMLGVRLDKFSIGTEVSDNYFSFTGQNIDKRLVGALNIVRGTINGYYEPIHWFELKWGIGAAWYKSAFDLNNTQIIGKSEAGGSLLLNASFRPWKYLEINLLNRIDIFFSNEYITPYYLGGLELNFHPYVEWVNLYIEALGMPWIYKGEPIDINTGMFIWGIGAAIDISLPYSYNNIKKENKKN